MTMVILGQIGITSSVIASHPVGAKRRRMTGSAKQSIDPQTWNDGLLRRYRSSQ